MIFCLMGFFMSKDELMLDTQSRDMPYLERSEHVDRVDWSGASISVRMKSKKIINFNGNDYPEVKLSGRVNVPDWKILQNIRENIRRGLPQLKGFQPVDDPIMIAAGGPSLKRYIKNIKKKRDNGRKVVTVNGTHDFLLEHGIRPSMHIMIDGRPFNKRFVENAQDDCAYFIASHCDPSVFDALDGKRVYIFHTDGDTEKTPILEEYYRGNFYYVRGGSTVTLRAINILTILGRKNQEIYGFDSCFLNKKHHSYDQPENDTDGAIKIIPDCHGAGRKEFLCAPWMASQAKEFQEMIAMIGDQFRLAVYGPGLIAHMIRVGAHAELKEID